MRASTTALLVCPLCRGPFGWESVERRGDEIASARVPCPSCGTVSAVRDGIGYFLPGDAPEGIPHPGAGAPPTPVPPGWEAAWSNARDHLRRELHPGAGPVLELGF